MTRSGQNVSAVEPAEQRRQGTYLLVASGNRAHGRWSATEDTVLPVRTQRFCAGALVEDGGSLQRAGRGGTAETVPRTGGVAGRRPTGSTRAGEPGTTGAHAPVRGLLVGGGTMATAGMGSIFRGVPGGAGGRCPVVARDRGAGD